jgi:hypothetical protein
MPLLLDADLDEWWSVDAAAFSVIPRCRCILVGLSPLEDGACVVCVGWMEPVQPTVAAHAAWFGVLCYLAFGLPVVFPATAAIAVAAATTIWYILFVCHCF